MPDVRRQRVHLDEGKYPLDRKAISNNELQRKTARLAEGQKYRSARSVPPTQLEAVLIGMTGD